MSFNILIIVLDTLREDYKIPFNEILSNWEFKYYSRAITPAPWTLPSHASMFTRLYPLQHGAHESKKKDQYAHIAFLTDIKLAKSKQYFLITKYLQEHGYTNYFYSANPYIDPIFGFGFLDFNFHPKNFKPIFTFQEAKELEKIVSKNISKIAILKKLFAEKKFKFIYKIIIHYLSWKIPSIKKKYFSWLPSKIILDKGASAILYSLKKTYPTNPYFIFINFMELHEPYFTNPKKDIPPFINNFNKPNNVDSELIKKAYLKDAVYLSKKIKYLLDFLKKRDLLHNTLIIVLSDHGQLLGEYDKYGHGTFLYDTLVRIPMWIKYPKNFKVIPEKNNKKWISLVNIKKFILNALETNIFDERLLFSTYAFSEAYGVNARVDLSKIKYKNEYYKYNKYRIAIYYNDFKGIFNIEDWKFEKIISYENKEVSEEIKKKMLNGLTNFLKISLVKNI